jgi:hypothetical protein
VNFDGAFPDGRANENADSRDHGRISHSGLFQSPAAPIEESANRVRILSYQILSSKPRLMFAFFTWRGRAEWHKVPWAGCAGGTTETLQLLFDVVALWLDKERMEEKLPLKHSTQPNASCKSAKHRPADKKKVHALPI